MHPRVSHHLVSLKIPDAHIRDPETFNAACCGFAVGGHAQALAKLLDEGGSPRWADLLACGLGGAATLRLVIERMVVPSDQIPAEHLYYDASRYGRADSWALLQSLGMSPGRNGAFLEALLTSRGPGYDHWKRNMPLSAVRSYSSSNDSGRITPTCFQVLEIVQAHEGPLSEKLLPGVTCYHYSLGWPRPWLPRALLSPWKPIGCPVR